MMHACVTASFNEREQMEMKTEMTTLDKTETGHEKLHFKFILHCHCFLCMNHGPHRHWG